MAMEQSGTSNGLEEDLVQIYDLTKATSIDTTIPPSECNMKTNLSPKQDVQMDESPLGQGKGRIGNMQKIIQSGTLQDTSFETNTDETTTTSVHPLCKAVSTNQGTHPHDVECNEVEVSGLQPCLNQLDSESINPTNSEGNFFLKFARFQYRNNHILHCNHIEYGLTKCIFVFCSEHDI